MKHLYSRFLDGDYRRMNTFGTGIGLSLTHDSNSAASSME